MARKGKFFVLEGIDGAGGETQSALLADRLRENSFSVEKLSYPDYEGPIGELIHRYLHNECDFPKDVQLLLYGADFLKDAEKIRQWLLVGKIVITDRYFTSALVYQCVNGVALEKALAIGKLLEFPIPDKIIYLDISPETSIQRKTKEKAGNLDRNESNRQFLSDLVHFYKRLIQENTFAPWEVVNGEQSKDEVAKSIWQIISRQLD